MKYINRIEIDSKFSIDMWNEIDYTILFKSCQFILKEINKIYIDFLVEIY